MTAPSRLDTVYCTDEDIVAVAGADFLALSARSALLAAGTDGYFDVPTPFVLGSASVDFSASGVASNQIVHLSSANTKTFKGGGELLAIDSVDALSATLRWPGQPLGVGQGPGFGGKVGVRFEVRTMAAQIESASFDINERFAIDPNLAWRSPDRIYDLRVLRQLAVLMVLYRAYRDGIRDEAGDWKIKLGQYKADLGDAIARASVRWGSQGTDQPATNVFGTRLSR